MIAVTAKQIIADINRLCEQSITGVPQIPRGLSSETIFVPSLQFLENEWIRFWDRYKEVRKTEDLVRSLGKARICDLFARAAQFEFGMVAAKKAAETKVDATGGMFFAHIKINVDEFMGIPFGSHATTVIAFTRDDKNVELAFWEPQQQIGKPFTYEPLEKAVTAGIDLHDVII